MRNENPSLELIDFCFCSFDNCVDGEQRFKRTAGSRSQHRPLIADKSTVPSSASRVLTSLSGAVSWGPSVRGRGMALVLDRAMEAPAPMVSWAEFPVEEVAALAPLVPENLALWRVLEASLGSSTFSNSLTPLS